jgi:hypothetical protein
MADTDTSFPFSHLLCSHPCRFDSRLAAPGETPADWCFLPEATGEEWRIKDTGRSARYRNVVLDSVRVRYALPLGPHAAKLGLLDNYDTRPRPIRYYMCVNGFDHYLGKYVVTGYVNTPAEASCVLHRLVDQGEDAGPVGGDKRFKRSKSEARHETLLRGLFPPPCRVAHEPESAVGLRGQLFVDGKLQKWASDVYIPDFCVTTFSPSKRMPFRLAVESKYDADGADDVAFEKCRQLTEAHGYCVVLIYGHGEDARFVDFSETPDAPRVMSRAEFESDFVPRFVS